MYYTGIGSRSTPHTVLVQMSLLGIEYASRGYTLRSGGAPGADRAFEHGAGSGSEIFLPWPHFNGHLSSLCRPSPEAFALAERFHPNWSACSPGARALHARNSHQVLGLDLRTPSLFIICWTPGGTGSGGTGQALRIAREYGIRIFDLGSPIASTLP